ncbi:MAG: glycosyltransferase family 4 protein [Thermoleophilaceae bacterium]|nr:glycosyltransferase family 4 protein [Thermoleophilaceae bacterium]
MARLRGWKVAGHLRGSEFRELYAHQNRLVRSLIKASLIRLSSVAVMGESLQWVFNGLVDPERITVVSNGTPDQGVAPFEEEEPMGLFISGLRARKGVIEAFDAALEVLEEEPTARFVFAGEAAEPALYEQLERRARRHPERMRLLDVVTGEERRRLFLAASYLVFPPVEPEGHPRVVIEGLGAGLPVIATDRGAIAESVMDGECGYVLADPDPTLLAERMLRLVRDVELRRRMALAARQRFEEHFTQEAADERLALWLEDVQRSPL